MKVLYKLSTAVFLSLFFLACNDYDQMQSAVPEGVDFIQAHQRKCETMKVLDRQLKENPGLAKRLEAIERATQRFINAKGKPNNNGNGNGNGNGGGDGGGGGDGTPFTGTVTIPVVVNVLYSNPAENIPLSQIQSQIDILNQDFSASNGDLNNVPSIFQNSIGNMDIQFTLDAVNRKSSRKTSWGTRDTMKNSKRGGIDATDPATKLNIWVCEIGGGILGYAQFPGGSLATDGVVVGPKYFGLSGSAGAPFNLGRTTTHEVGHWLNLRHIWGDGGCSVDDFVADTPVSDSPNYGCPTFPLQKCSSTDMTMNYMDYVNDECMYMFSTGQVDRSRALFASGAVRDSFVTP